MPYSKASLGAWERAELWSYSTSTTLRKRLLLVACHCGLSCIQPTRQLVGVTVVLIKQRISILCISSKHRSVYSYVEAGKAS